MPNHGTLSIEDEQAPGWYRQFLADAVLQLPGPSEISQGIALGWHNNRGAMKKAFREALLPPDKRVRSVAITVDCDYDPHIPPSFLLTGKGTKHRWMGMITLEKRDGKLYANGHEVVRYLSPNQQNGKIIQGHKLRKELKDKQALNACILDVLLSHPELIPDEWKTGVTYFWGTIFRMADEGLCVLGLWWSGCGWTWLHHWLGVGWDASKPAACLADLPSAA